MRADELTAWYNKECDEMRAKVIAWRANITDVNAHVRKCNAVVLEYLKLWKAYLEDLASCTDGVLRADIEEHLRLSKVFTPRDQDEGKLQKSSDRLTAHGIVWRPPPV